MRLVKIAKTPDKNMLQVDIPEGTGIWGFCPANVKEIAKNTIQEGDEVELTYKFENGQLNISFIKKAGQGNYFPPQQGTQPVQQPQQQPQQGYQPPQQTGQGHPCEVCGKPVKDSRYPKCYTCNQKAPKQTTSGRDTGESIERQNCNNATSRALMVLQGQVDLNNIVSIIDTLWEAFYAKLKK